MYCFTKKKILRTITSSEFLAHSPPLFQETKILPIREIYQYLLAIHMFKLQSSNLLSYPDYSYNTRARKLTVPTFQRLTNTKESVNLKARPHLQQITATATSVADFLQPTLQSTRFSATQHRSGSLETVVVAYL